MNLAPIGVSTYSRLSHLKQTIDALRANILAKDSDLYVFSDAAKQGDEKKVAAVRKYIDTISGFKNVHIIKREENSRVKNSRGGIARLLEKYGKCIFLEEDIVTAPGFLTFMNESLNAYENEEKIFSISGYTPPINIPDDYSFDFFILRRASGWGIGIWHDRFKKISHLDNAEVQNRFSNHKEVEELSKYGEDLLKMILLEAAGKRDAFDIKVFYHQYLNEEYTIYPRKSLVRNIGHDGSGIHCGKTNKFHVELWDKLKFEVKGNLELDDRIVRSNYEFRRIGSAPKVVQDSNASIEEDISETEKLGENIIFLISQPRAGSTLLQRILNGHSDIHATAEPWIMLHPLYGLKKNGLVAEYDSELARLGLEDFISQVPEGQELYLKALRHMGGTLYNRALEVSGKRFFLDKTPRYHFIIPELKAVFPEAKFIFLLRNPLAVLSSTLESWFQNNPESLKKSLNYFDLLKGPLHLIQGIQLLKGDAVVVRYEELVEETETTVKAICYKLGIAYQNEMLNYGSNPKPEGRFGDSIGIIKHNTAVSSYIDKWIKNLQSIPLYEFATKYMETLGPEVFDVMGYPYQENKDKLEKSLYQEANSEGKIKETTACLQVGKPKKNQHIDDSIKGLQDPNNQLPSSSCRCSEDCQTCSCDNDYLVSAIVSCYNSEDFIRGRLEDLEAQTIAQKLEIIVVDSGSEQNERAVVDEFKKTNTNIKYIRTANRETIYAAWNCGVKAASGKYIINANSDDRLRKDALEIMSRALEENASVGAVYIDQILTKYPNETFANHHTDGFLKRSEATREIMVQKNPCGPQVMWRRDLHKKIGFFQPDYEVAGDWDFWLRLVFETDYTILHIPELLGLYYYNLGGLEHGGRKQKERLREINMIKEKYGKLYRVALSNASSECGSRTTEAKGCTIKETKNRSLGPIEQNKNEARNILLTTSAAPGQTPFSTTEKRAPIGIGFLISVLRDAGHNVSFIDNYLKPSDFLETDYLQVNNIEFVGIYANTICYRDTLRMLHKLEWFRQTGRWEGKIIVGGPHATVNLDTIPDFVDYVVQGEGERAIVDIVEGKTEQRVLKYPRIKNLDELPMPAWDYFVKLPYAWGGEFFPEGPVFSMNTSRGCPYSCQFCSVKSIWGKKYSFFSAERIISDIEYLIKTYGAKGIYFREDNFTLNRKRLEKFCNLIIERGIKISWACETRVNVLDEEIVELMSKAGACGFYIGVESGSQKILNLLKKGIQVEETRKAFQVCHRYGIKTAASIVVGVPNETEADLKKTFALIEDIKPTITWFNVFVGIPNSELYQYALENKLYEFIDDRGLVYLKGHNQRVQAFYEGRWDAGIPYFNSDQPKISVVMSVFNGEDYVENAIESILSQTYANFEFIIVDDASTDCTAEILAKFDDCRIKIITNDKNLGLTKCLNKAISTAKGEFIARMDADDISLPHRFEKQLDFLEKNPDYALVGSAYYRINENGATCQLINVLTDDGEIKIGLQKQNWFGHGSVMLRRDVFVEMEGYSARFKYAQDYDLWLRISERYKIANIAEPLYCWRSTENSISREKEKEQRDYAYLAVAESRRRQKEAKEDQSLEPMVSVIVPTFNRPQMLKEALKSILNQTYQNFEIVVVNDGGMDVAGLVDDFQDSRVKYIVHPNNKGLAAARNTGIQNTSGQYIALLDDDDLFYPEHLGTAVNMLSKEIAVIYTDAVRATYDRCGDVYHLIKKNVPYSIDFDRNKLLVGNLSPVNCFVFEKSLAVKVGLFDETLSTLEDWDFWIRLSSLTSFKHIAKPTVQVNWRSDGTTMTSLLGAEFGKNRQKIYNKYQDEINQIPNVEEILNEFQKIWTQDWQGESPLTSIIMLTCNQLQYTKKCIESILQHTQKPYELIIVDNGSTDDTVEYLESEVLGNHPDLSIKIIKNKENKGFAGGNNQGMAVASGDYVLLLNNDVVVTPGWLERMLSCAEKRPEIGIVGPRSNTVSGPQRVEEVNYDTQTLKGLAEFSNKFADDRAAQAEQVLRVVGFCMLIKRAVIDKIGAMDDRYGLGNFEDDDFSLRAAIAGFQSWIARDCFVHHFGHRTFIGEKVDLNKSLHKNWGVFKEKWGLPADKPYGSPYSLSEMKHTRFDPSIHYTPLDNERAAMDKSNNDFESTETRYSAIMANLNSKPSQEVIEDLQRLIESYPEFALAYNDLGVLYYSSGNKEKALECYERAMRLDPENSNFSKNLADFYFVEMGRIEEALQIYVKILKLNPEDIETLLITGHICVALHQFEDAKVFYQRVLELEPQNEAAQSNLNKLDKMDPITLEFKSPEELYQEIQPLLNSGDPHKGISLLEKLLQNYPDFALAHNDLGVLHYHTGDKEKARHHYGRAVELMPDNINFQKNLADFLFVEQAKVEEALQIYVNILATHPDDVETLLITAHICVALKKFDDAKEFYERVLGLAPDNEDASKNLQALMNRQVVRSPAILDSLNDVNVSSEKKESKDLNAEESDTRDTENKSIVSIVIRLNGIDNRIKECLKSIEAHTADPYELLLVDHGSTKGMLKWAQQLVKDKDHYRIIECTGQAGRAESLNQAIRQAHGEIIVLLHNDAVVPEDWLKGFKKCIKIEPNIGVVGPMSNRAAGIQQLMDTDEFDRVEFESTAKAFREQNEYRRVATRKLSDFCLVFRRELPDKIGYFDEQFASEEVIAEDFCNRAVSGGYQNLIAADTYVYHYDRHKLEKNASTQHSTSGKDEKKYREKWNDNQSPEVKAFQTVLSLSKANELSQKGQIDQAVDIFLNAIGIQPEEKRIYLSLAEILLAAKRFQDAKEALSEMPLGNGNPEIKEVLLLGYAEEGLENYEAARTCIEKVMAMDPKHAQGLNLKGILAFRNNDRHSAEKYFKRAMASDPGYGEPYTNLAMLQMEAEQAEGALEFFEKGFILSPTDLDIATNYHAFIEGLGDFARAEKVARQAADLYPNNQKIKYMLIDFLVQQGKYEMAMPEIEDAIIKFGIDDGILGAALKLREKLGPMTVKKSSKKVPVSLCMIIKDEEKYLARCLASVKPIVDEMIVVDTGSADRSKDIAIALGAQVNDYDWENDFAAARNFSISKASGEWILILDGDEVISPLDYDHFNKIVAKKRKAPVAYSITTRNYNKLANIVGWVPNDGQYPDEEAAIGWLPSEKVRLFYGKDQIRFEGAVHELVDPVLKRNNIEIKKCSIPVHHYGRLDKEKMERKGETYFDIGQKKLSEKGEDVNALRELAIQATILEKNQEALELWQRLLALNPDSNLAAIAYVNMGTIYCRLEKFDDALDAANKAIECVPDLKEARYNQAMAELHCGNAQNTIRILERLLDQFPDYPPAQFILSAAYCCAGQKEKGLDSIRKLKNTPLGAHLEMPCIELAQSLLAAKKVQYALWVLGAAIECDMVNKEILDLFAECMKLNKQARKLPEIPPKGATGQQLVLFEDLPQ